MISNLTTRQNRTHTNNYRNGRAWTHGVDCIVIHVTEGTADSVRSWFNDPAAQVSAHYMVTKAGGVESFVDEDDTAYHAGQLVEPAAALVRLRYADGRYTPNSYGIGIEHEGDGKHEMTDAQRAASLALVVDICRRHNVPVDRQHILAHHEIKASKTCPGAIDVDRIVADVAAEIGGAQPPVVPPVPPVPPAALTPVWSGMLGWLVPVTVTDDATWTFATVKEIRDAIQAGRVPTTMEAGTPLSHMTRALT